MAALTYGWSQGERMESVVETAGTDLSVTADAAADTLVTNSASVQALEAAVTSAVAAAQLVGTGDASAEIDAIDVAWAAILTTINTLQTQVTATKAATLAAEPVDTVEVRILTGQKASDVIVGLDNIKARIATSKVLAP